LTARIAELVQALTEAPDQPAEAYLDLGRHLYRAGRFADGEAWTARAVARHPDAHALWNLRGATLRALRRPEEALAALDRAVALASGEAGARVNRASALMDLGRRDEAKAALGEVVAEAPKVVEAWLLLAGLADTAAAAAVLDRGLAANPGDARLAEAKVLALRAAGDTPAAEAWLESLPPALAGQAWAAFHLGDLLAERDRGRAIGLLRRAHELEPSLHHLALLAQTLARDTGEGEGAALDEADGLARQALEAGGLNPGHLKILSEVFARVCAFDDLDRLGDFRTLGRLWAQSGRHTALLRQMPRVESLDDRRELLEQHRIWGREVEARAAADPIRKARPRPDGGPIRLGFLSSDLRRHPVGYFALPLFDHLDRARFEVFVYSFFPSAADDLQRDMAAKATAYRVLTEMSARAAAQTIADDRLDMLIELGGTTAMNRLEVMAWRAAPRQASWLGYPHSAGLAAIDHMVCDPFNVPPDPGLMLEAPLVLPRTWIALGRAVFADQHPIEAGLPEDRAGALTFGTAGNPHKFNRPTLAAWARITAAVPGARFAFVRPEGGAETFRRRILAAFAAAGVGEDRVIFHPVRGGHMPLYNGIDISLDTFPLTGGATTAEALWMGVPVVSLKGPAFYERLSHSILSNAGLGDLVAEDIAGFERIALGLAADRPRRAALRQGLRGQIRQGPLGQTEAFARDFYDAVAAVVGRG
jgi:protein O-GlcNAc transferase